MIGLFVGLNTRKAEQNADLYSERGKDEVRGTAGSGAAGACARDKHNRVVGVMVSAQDYEAMRAFYADRLRGTLKEAAQQAADKGLTQAELDRLLTDEDQACRG